MDELKVVSIGGFGHSVLVFDDMLGMQEVQLCGLAPAFDGEDISAFANHQLCNDKPVFDNYKKMLAKLKPDVAIISTRLDLIVDIAIEAARAGCHLICEKPLALNPEKLQELYDVLKTSKVKVGAMLSMRSEPQFIAAHDLYKSGLIGEAVIVNGRKSYKWGTRPEWFGDMKTYGGTIGWIGIHALDFINYITGLEFTSVSAMGNNFGHPEREGCDDNCGMILEMSNGGHATISVDFFRPANSDTWGDDWVRIVGTRGIIEARGIDVSCTLLADKEKPVKIELPERSKIFKEFLLSLLDNRECVLGAKELFMLTNACHCSQKALEQKMNVKIDNSKWIF